MANDIIVELLGCTTTLAILNLHLFLRDTDIYGRMSCLLRLEDRFSCEVTHLARLGLKMQETALPVVLLFGKMNEAALDDGTQSFR